MIKAKENILKNIEYNYIRKIKLKNKNLIIAIDGHASAGKSTAAKDLAKSLNYLYIDSGAMYRCVTLYFLRNHVDITNIVDIADALGNINISFSYNYDIEKNEVFLNDENVTEQIRSREVTDFVSPVAAIKLVRSYLVKQQRAFKSKSGIVMDGRDIGTVVYPDADLKVFLTADIEVRVNRRQNELLKKGRATELEDVKNNLIYRDHKDSTREISPLKIADDAVVVNNSHYNREQQLDLLKQLVEDVLNKKA